MNASSLLCSVCALATLGGCASMVSAFQPDLPCNSKEHNCRTDKHYDLPIEKNGFCNGRAVAIAVDPSNSQHLLVASANGGLFATTDGGAHFTHVDTLPSFDVVDVAFAPGDPNRVVATASADHHVANGPIWLSKDGGATWSTRFVAAATKPGAGCKDPASGYGLSFEPKSNTVYAGTDCGLAFSDDLGETWKHEDPADPTVPDNGDLTQNRVWSVLAQAGGRVNIAAEDGVWYRASKTDPWQHAAPPDADRPVNAEKSKTTHAFAASPYYPEHLFYVGRPKSGSTICPADPNKPKPPILYLSSDGGKHWTFQKCLISNQPPFVRVTQTPDSKNQFVIFFGDGKDVITRTFEDAAGGATPLSTIWKTATVDHVDPFDVAFNTSGAPIMLVTDGGVHRTRDGGATWTSSGAGPQGGYNALLITEVTGQEVSGDKPHQDLYFGTQDNGLFMSSEGGAASTWCRYVVAEGARIRCATRKSSGHEKNEDKVTGHSVGGGSGAGNFLTDYHFPETHPSGYHNPSDGDTITDDDPADEGTPFPFRRKHYIQNTVNDDLGVNTLWLTENNGESSGSLSTGLHPGWKAVATNVPLDKTLHGAPAIAGDSSDPVVYHAVELDDPETIGLIRISGFYSTTATVSRADGTGGKPLPGSSATDLGNLGVFTPARYAEHAAFGVDPNRPDHLIAADIDSEQMKYSTDGGANWYPDAALTALVTGNGSSRFQLDGSPIVHAIGFDPDNLEGCHVLVGTKQNGVFRSTDGGSTWSLIAGSEKIGNLSSFYFPPTGDIVVSSYGSGLWKLHLERDMKCKIQVPSRGSIGPATVPIIHLPGRGTIPLKDIGDPDVCPSCQYVIASHGTIAEVKMEGRRVTSVMLKRGTLHQVDARKNEVPLTIPNGYSRTVRGGPGQMFAAIVKQRLPIRGLVIEGDVLKGIITSPRELPFRPARVPYVWVGTPEVGPGGTVTLRGRGFAPPSAGGAPVRVRVDGEVVAEGIAVDEKGLLVARVPVQRPPGEYEISVEQQEGKRLSVEKRRVEVPREGD